MIHISKEAEEQIKNICKNMPNREDELALMGKILVLGLRFGCCEGTKNNLFIYPWDKNNFFWSWEADGKQVMNGGLVCETRWFDRHMRGMEVEPFETLEKVVYGSHT